MLIVNNINDDNNNNNFIYTIFTWTMLQSAYQNEKQQDKTEQNRNEENVIYFSALSCFDLNMEITF